MTVQFNDMQKDSIEEMSTLLGITQAAVIKKALALLTIAVREKRLGNQIAVVSNGQVVKELVGITDWIK